ncbi:MAG: CpcT/CpeT family chromophore lyase [Hyphomonas sp.]
MRFTPMLLAAAFMAAPSSAETTAGPPDPAAEFAGIATGSWTSRQQSADPRYDWVESETVRILPDRSDGVWLYQENAIMAPSPQETPADGAKDRPYFQIVIQLRSIGAHEVHATTYRLDTPEARTGARGLWKTTSLEFDPAWIGTVACMNEMGRISEGYWTGQADCPNTYRGGVKVDSRSVRTPDSYVNWDRGFDAEGQHVWGPREGGYVFRRQEAAE